MLEKTRFKLSLSMGSQGGNQLQHLCKRRAEAANPDTINTFYASFKEEGLDLIDPEAAHHLWNCDETAFCTKRGVRALHEVGGGSGREYIIVHACCSASGQRLPLFILYKGKSMYVPSLDGGSSCWVCIRHQWVWLDGCSQLSFMVAKACLFPLAQSTF